MQAPQRRFSSTRSIRRRVCQHAGLNIGRRWINALRFRPHNQAPGRAAVRPNFLATPDETLLSAFLPNSMTENRFILRFHVAILVIVLLGFARTFYMRDWIFNRPLNSGLQLHGALLTAWFAVTSFQAYLISSGRRNLHRQIAWIACIIALSVVLSASWINTRLAMTLHSAAEPENILIWGNYLTLVAFTGLFLSAVQRRRNPQAHRRLILFASIVIVGPAFARFAFWPIFNFGIGIAPIFSVGGILVLLAIGAAYDFLSLGKLHSATIAGIASVVLSIAVGVGIGVSGLGFGALNSLGIVTKIDLTIPASH